MPKQIIGIDIGDCNVKMAVCSAGAVQRMAVHELPENMVTGGRILSPDSMSEFLKDMKRTHHIPGRDVAVILPEQSVFFRQLSMPAMTADQLKINLPYEFRDYINREKDKYFYDYAVVDRTDDKDGVPVEFELTAAAVLKETISEYRDMFRRAGLKLRVALPQEMAWSNLLRNYEEKYPLSGEGTVLPSGKEPSPAGDGTAADEPQEREYCLLDIGHTATRLYLFHGRRLEMSKLIDNGCSLLDAAIAETMDVDQHVARVYKQTNYENALDAEACQNVYGAIALEVMKALNFHSYEHRDNHLETVHYCGGGSRIAPLIEAIGGAIDLRLVSIESLLPSLPDEAEDALSCAAAIGATQQ
ncbi:pilus assembly protein PilM [Butyricicoccus faecihominis]|uniref:pilus assembly protein PilM n=1 Tax=Butyricicoccus faecihominis TaxID=1712515 RepID=UPI00247A26EA|nr:pilus assembly protein PilM [Butyricicoccus faecihominis]MCQ5131339.1 pilus assembly protein PilM [Butyricicoccus faecihominis]